MSVSALIADKKSIYQLLLASKIMTLVNSPTLKKILNLTHYWLSLIEVESFASDDENLVNLFEMYDDNDNGGKMEKKKRSPPQAAAAEVIEKEEGSKNFAHATPAASTIPEIEKPSGLVGPWRFPQRSETSYVNCILETIHFLLTTSIAQDHTKELSALKSDQMLLALQSELIDMVSNDLNFDIPEDSGARACDIAIRTFSDTTVKLSEDCLKLVASAETEGSINEEDWKNYDVIDSNDNESDAKSAKEFLNLVPDTVRRKVTDVGVILQTISEEEEDLPPLLYLDEGEGNMNLKSVDEKESKNNNASNASNASTKNKAHVQFRDLLAWDMELNTPDPGQTISLRKYDPVDMLLIKERAKTREEAVDALRLCDQMCILLGNQKHCVSNANG